MASRFPLSAAFFLASPLLLHAAFVPLTGTTPVPVEQVRVDNPAVVPLTGRWKFQLTHGFMYQDERFSHMPLATASSVLGENVPAYGADDNKGSHWMAKGGFPQWWQLDLGEVLPVKALHLYFEVSAGQRGRALSAIRPPRWAHRLFRALANT